MSHWEYDKLDLNDPPRRRTDLDLLNEAGHAGWELVALTANNIAILKREIVTASPRTRSRVATPGKGQDA